MPAALLSIVLLATAQLKPWPKNDITPGQVKGVDGKTYSIPAEGTKATVVLFVTVDCPIGNRYAPEINRIVAKYGKQVAFYLAYTDPSVGLAAIKKHRHDFSLKLPAFQDASHTWVNKVGAAVTPEAALISPKGKLLYRGRIDDLFLSPGSRRPKPEHYDLRKAIDETLAGKPVTDPMMLPVGCAIASLR